MNAPVIMVSVPCLPKDALVELHYVFTREEALDNVVTDTSFHSTEFCEIELQKLVNHSIISLVCVASNFGEADCNSQLYNSILESYLLYLKSILQELSTEYDFVSFKMFIPSWTNCKEQRAKITSTFAELKLNTFVIPVISMRFQVTDNAIIASQILGIKI
jgi:hypothetical protein